MSRLVLTVGFILGIGMIAACGRDDQPVVDGPSVLPGADPETPEIDTSNPEIETLDPETEPPNQERVRLLDGNCVVPASQLAELEDRLGAECE